MGPGIIKYGGFICLMTEEQRIEYEPKEQMQVLYLLVGNYGKLLSIDSGLLPRFLHEGGKDTIPKVPEMSVW